MAGVCELEIARPGIQYTVKEGDEHSGSVSLGKRRVHIGEAFARLLLVLRRGA